MPEVIKIIVELEQRDTETAFPKLLRAALGDVKRDQVNPAGTHVAGIGYYRVIDHETTE